jgi:hypothetical protein
VVLLGEGDGVASCAQDPAPSLTHSGNALAVHIVTWLRDEEARVARPMGASVGWQGTSRAHEYATLREMTRTSETKLRKSGRVLTSHRRSARRLVTSAGSSTRRALRGQVADLPPDGYKHSGLPS